jgi:hypothetical protein
LGAPVTAASFARFVPARIIESAIFTHFIPSA